MTDLKADTSLHAIRREIDGIDEAIAELLVKRFAATARVRATKTEDGSLSASPWRPAREAMMLRRLISRHGSALDPQLLVRLWRVILSASTQSQATITLHVAEELAGNVNLRVQLAEHFCGMRINVHPDIARTLAAASTARGDLAVLTTRSNWAAALAKNGRGQIIGTLPVTGPSREPALLIHGHAEPQPSGHDQTIIVTPNIVAEHQLPRDFRWQAASGDWTVLGLDGFLQESDPALAEFLQGFPTAMIAGRCPAPIEVTQ
jgi:chorismate mutase